MQPQFIQRNPDELQRRRLAQEMVRRGTSSAPIRHPLQGFARLAEALSGHGQIQAMDAAKAKRSDRYAQTMQDALSAYEGTPETKEPFVPDKFDETEVIPGEGGLQSVTPAKKGSFAELARALANNPDTAQLSMQLQLQEMQNKRAAEAAENKYQRGRADKMSDAKEMALFKGLTGSGNPKDVQTAIWYLNASDAEKEAFDKTKRAAQILNLGGTQKVLGTGQEFDVTLKPENQPEAIEAEAKVKANVAQTALLKKNLPKARASLKTAIDKKKFVKSEIKRAIDLIGPSTTGAGSLLANLPATDARSLKAAILAIQSNVAFDALSEMRQNSPTGGAVGQLSDSEREAMAATVGTLDQALDGDDLKRALQGVDTQLDQSFTRIQNAFDEDFASVMEKKEPEVNADKGIKAGDVDDGYMFNGGDPADPNSWTKL